MDNAVAYQSQIVADRRVAEAARAARDYTRRHPAPEIAESGTRRRPLRVGWPRPARAGFLH